MTDTQKYHINRLFDKYYLHLLNTCRLKLRQSGLDCDIAEDIVQECALRICTFDEEFLQQVIDQEQLGESRYFFNLLRSMITHNSLDQTRIRRLLNFDSADDQTRIRRLLNLDAPDGDNCLLGLSESDYSQLRVVSCNLRDDSFIDPRRNDDYSPISVGYVSGWIHAYEVKGTRYTYWQYSAFYGSRCKGETPKRIKTSSSRHGAYMALCKYNMELRSKTELLNT